ncbi:ATP-dependent nuclease [Paenibacillus lemnae]|uniref:AAA family ATPase n=1 Tax=Paenibacillus lemnae TaxID=1330551 RepID=A0A848M5E4_PAELE|nr:AAA family ATPase [Paenibacillus lemnae]NMO95816.1 AAA family ATPase [Paenibacillus lemnae]
MYISSINIENFRNFKGPNNIVEFNEGMNVIIGHNNSGKSNLLKAMELVLSVGSSKRLTVDDFNKEVIISELKAASPRISITVTFTESADEAEFSEDLVTVSNWLTELNKPYKASLTYMFYLPEKEEEDYRQAMTNITSDITEDYWQVIKHSFLRKYKTNIYAGDLSLKQVADNESLKKIDFQFIDAIRDVERDLFTGRNTLLREVIDFFMDYSIKNSRKDKQTQLQEIEQLKKEFSRNAATLIQSLKDRMNSGKVEMLSYANDTGASFGNAFPDFDGNILDSELYSALRLIVKYETGISIPATHNGLGYNNLIFMSLLLAKMQKDASGDYLGSNAKTFPVLVIEEPEAHLHPAMQYKFLKFLRENGKSKARQIFITTHSPNITSAVPLDEILCFHRTEQGQLNIGYLGKIFEGDSAGKAYVERFLDTTKSDMLFAKSVILVEGLAEQLTMSLFARYLGMDLESNHVSVININGRFFNHFLKLFDKTKPHTIHKPIACITDLDPLREKLPEKCEDASESAESIVSEADSDTDETSTGDQEIELEADKLEKCYPFELGLDPEQFSYKPYSNKLIDQELSDNMRCFSQDVGNGRTFEYSLAYENPGNSLLLIEGMTNYSELNKLFNSYLEGNKTEELLQILNRRGKLNQRIRVNIIKYEGQDKREHILAARYLNSVSKGENAFELAHTLEANLLKEEPQPFKVPKYIAEAIEWILKK